MKTSSGCIGCVTGEKASQSVNFILEKSLENICNRFKSSDYSEISQIFWKIFQKFWKFQNYYQNINFRWEFMVFQWQLGSF